MPRAINLDWELAKSLRQQGIPYTVIAKRLECNVSTIRSRAFREKWDETNAKASEIMKQADINWAERAKGWPKRIAALMEKRLAFIEELPVSKLKMREFKELTAATKEVDEMARQAFEITPLVHQGKAAITVVVFPQDSTKPHVQDIVEDCDGIFQPSPQPPTTKLLD